MRCPNPPLLPSVLVALALAFAGCAGPPRIDGELTLTPNPSGHAALSALLAFTTDRPARPTLVIDDGLGPTEVRPFEDFRTEHRVPVLGVRADREVAVEVRLESERGKAASAGSLSFSTPPLPDDLPPIQVTTSRPAKMEPGVTLVPLFHWPGVEPEEDNGTIVALDAQGEVVWLYEAEHTIDEPRRLRNGNLLYTHGRAGNLFEIDMLGNVVREWHSTGVPKEVSASSIPVDTDTFHHDVLEMPNGNFLVLSTEVRRLDWPTSLDDPDAPRTPADVIGDVLVEFRPEDGEIVREWNFFDILDPYRLGHGSLSKGFYAEVYEDVLEEPGYDWTHTNSIFYQEDDDSVLVSVNHLCTVFELDLASGTIDWILGMPDGWREPWSELVLRPEGELTWFCHQHAAERTPQGTVLLFDNGGRAFPPAPDPPEDEDYSRAVEYRIDEEAGTATEVWSYGTPEGEHFFLSPFISEADALPSTGNVLVAAGGQMQDKNGKPTTNFAAGRHWATIVEVTHASPPEKVWEVVIDDPAGGWAVYRAQRVPSLYPGGEAPSRPGGAPSTTAR